MKPSTNPFARRGFTAGLSLLCACLGASALAHGPTDEVGRWLGFAHAAGRPPGPGGFAMDLVMDPSGAPILKGVISGLPAVQMPLGVTGFVSLGGRLVLILQRPTDGSVVGFCDGSVRQIDNYQPGSGQDDVTSLGFALIDDAGMLEFGHMNGLHMFGGEHWQMAGFDWSHVGGLPGRGTQGAFQPPSSDMAGRCGFFAAQDGGATSSAINGGIMLGTQGFQMIGTASSRGSLIMMGDGSVRTGDQNALIGLLFTGGIPAGVPGFAVGQFAVAPFAELLPAVQRGGRGSAIAFQWGVG